MMAHLYGCTISWSSLHHHIACLQSLIDDRSAALQVPLARLVEPEPCALGRHFFSPGKSKRWLSIFKRWLSIFWCVAPAAGILFAFLCAAVMERDVAHARLSSCLRTPTSIRRRGWTHVSVVGGCSLTSKGTG